jgi:hypothetical protein
MKLTFSEKIFNCLLAKVENHNQKYSQKVSIHQLVRVYKRGEEASQEAWSPSVTVAQAAMARVNMFLKLASKRSVKELYLKEDKDILFATHRNYKDDPKQPFWQFESLDHVSARSDLLLAHIADSDANAIFIPPEIEEV